MAAESPGEAPLFSVRIVEADFYLSPPLRGLDPVSDAADAPSHPRRKPLRLPVIRIYGATPAGQTVCAHVHGVLPYFYVPYNGPRDSVEAAREHCARLAASLDHALDVSLQREIPMGGHVFSAFVVRGIPFYGYHPGEALFVKVHLRNPVLVARAASVLQTGAAMGCELQPHESHIPYVLKFMIDYNLFGMNFLDARRVRFRRPFLPSVRAVGPRGDPPPMPLSVDVRASGGSLGGENRPKTWWDDHSAASLASFSHDDAMRQSTCALEVDIQASDILNRRLVDVATFTAMRAPADTQRPQPSELQLVRSLAAMWEEERRRRRSMGLSSQPTQAPTQAREDPTPWDREEAVLDKLRAHVTADHVTEPEDGAARMEEGALAADGPDGHVPLAFASPPFRTLGSPLQPFDRPFRRSPREDERSEAFANDVDDDSAVGLFEHAMRAAHLLCSQGDEGMGEGARGDRGDRLVAATQSNEPIDHGHWDARARRGTTITGAVGHVAGASTALSVQADVDERLLGMSRADVERETEEMLRAMADATWDDAEEEAGDAAGRGGVFGEPDEHADDAIFGGLVGAEGESVGVGFRRMPEAGEGAALAFEEDEWSGGHDGRDSDDELLGRLSLSGFEAKGGWGSHVPQYDGAGDEELPDHMTRTFAGKAKGRASRPNTVKVRNVSAVRLDGSKGCDEPGSPHVTRIPATELGSDELTLPRLSMWSPVHSEGEGGGDHAQTRAILPNGLSPPRILPSPTSSPPPIGRSVPKMSTLFGWVEASASGGEEARRSPLWVPESPVRPAQGNVEAAESYVRGTPDVDADAAVGWSAQSVPAAEAPPFDAVMATPEDELRATHSEAAAGYVCATPDASGHVASVDAMERSQAPREQSPRVDTVGRPMGTCDAVEAAVAAVDVGLVTLDRVRTAGDGASRDGDSVAVSASQECDRSLRSDAASINTASTALVPDGQVPSRADCTPASLGGDVRATSAGTPLSARHSSSATGAVTTSSASSGPANRVLSGVAVTCVDDCAWLAAWDAASGLRARGGTLRTPALLPPRPSDCPKDMRALELPMEIHREPFYSNPSDVPPRVVALGGHEFRFRPLVVGTVKEFHEGGGDGARTGDAGQKGPRVWVPARLPPTPASVRAWMEERLLRDGGVPSATHVTKEEPSRDGSGESVGARGERKRAASPPAGKTSKRMALDAPEVKGKRAMDVDVRPVNTRVEPHSNAKAVPQAAVAPSPDAPSDGARPSLVSVIEGPTLLHSYGCKVSGGYGSAGRRHQDVQHVCAVFVEVHAASRGALLPDPQQDAAVAVFYCVRRDDPLAVNGARVDVGVIAADGGSSSGYVGGMPWESVQDESALFACFIRRVREWDPDILGGFEVQVSSFGFLVDRAKRIGIDLCSELSRVPNLGDSGFDKEEDPYAYAHTSGMKIAGRVVVNAWRIARGEAALNIYTFENVAFHVLRRRYPSYDQKTLHGWWTGADDAGLAVPVDGPQGEQPRRPPLRAKGLDRWRAVRHYCERVRGTCDILEHFNFIGRTGELARVFGILFNEVLLRGSQFRVESMMLRIAKPMNYVAVSPSKRQVSSMRAPECVPLIMEPHSRFHTSPVIVLDFQSLYPSVVIAYNYCYSTCLGRATTRQERQLGVGTVVTDSPEMRRILERGRRGGKKVGAADADEESRHASEESSADVAEGGLRVSPNGILFCSRNVRVGVLPRMLEEILRARVMVKDAMKRHKGDAGLYRLLDARQLGLKMIANVTYGYTSATFSGRMPCVEIADSIVMTGRRTLERAIDMVNGEKEWGAKVVYGDTDSMFVLVPGATKERAFEVGRQIAERVTAANPWPVKLKFEKVYHPCVLEAKKRYVGAKYESPSQSEPDFDAKGIETVRRDTCPAVAKMLERSLKIAFRTRDLSLVKEYVVRQWTKLVEGRASLQDFVFAKEMRELEGYKDPLMQPVALLALRAREKDPRAMPRRGERVRFVVAHGPPNSRVIDGVRRPEELLADPSLRLNASYYIDHQIVPALERALGVAGADIRAWRAEMPRVQRAVPAQRPVAKPVAVFPPRAKRRRIDEGTRTLAHFFASVHCAACDAVCGSASRLPTRPFSFGVDGDGREGAIEARLQELGVSLCDACQQSRQAASLALVLRAQTIERAATQLMSVCVECTGDAELGAACVSLDCPVFYERKKNAQRLPEAQRCREAANVLDDFESAL